MAEIDALVLSEIVEFVRRLEARDVRVEGVYLFGSYAKGKPHELSDIDLAIISPDFSDDRFEERVRLMKLASGIDDRIEPIPYRPDNFSEDDPLAWDIMKHGVKVDLDWV